jgi:hypothetical protein
MNFICEKCKLTHREYNMYYDGTIDSPRICLSCFQDQKINEQLIYEVVIDQLDRTKRVLPTNAEGLTFSMKLHKIQSEMKFYLNKLKGE